MDIHEYKQGELVRHKPTGMVAKFDSMVEECDAGYETINARVYCDSELSPYVQWHLYDCEPYTDLTGEVAQLREDKARLDYLDCLNDKFNQRNRTIYGWKLDWNHNRISLQDSHYPAHSVREAIDTHRFTYGKSDDSKSAGKNG